MNNKSQVVSDILSTADQDRKSKALEKIQEITTWAADNWNLITFADRMSLIYDVAKAGLDERPLDKAGR